MTSLVWTVLGLGYLLLGSGKSKIEFSFIHYANQTNGLYAHTFLPFGILNQAKPGTKCLTSAHYFQSSNNSDNKNAAQNPCEKICSTNESSPVCANNRRTFENECEMLKESCKTKVPLMTVYKGRCVAAINGKPSFDSIGAQFGCIKKIRCDYQYEPVCGSDSQRYINPCHLIKEACLSKTAIIKVIDVPKFHFGECSELRCPTCDDTSELNIPRCGSDGKTYPSLCHLRAAACSQRSAVVPLHRGECLTINVEDSSQEAD